MSEPSTVKSARRVLEILELFSQGLRKATVMTVANALTYPQSSTSVLLSSLATLGFLRFDPTDRTYSPTLRVMLLGAGGWPGQLGRVAVGLSAYGLLIEICQHTLTTNRFGDPWDWVADSVGVVLGGLLARRAARGGVASA